MQDPNVTQWGALDRYQAHFIVSLDGVEGGEQGEKRIRSGGGGSSIFARTRVSTSGHFAAKKVESVEWTGASHPLLEMLNQDSELNGMIAEMTVWDAAIYVEQTGDDTVRIHGRWKDAAEFAISGELFKIYDRIAGHVRASCLPPV